MKTLVVCAAVVLQRQRFLLCRRPPGSHLAGHWEFPGGKVHEGESLEACIARELHEELGLKVVAARFLTTIDHDYPEKRIALHFLRCRLVPRQRPVPTEGQEAGWFTRRELPALELAPADRRFVDWLQVNLQMARGKA